MKRNLAAAAADVIIAIATGLAVAVLLLIVRAGWRGRDAFEPAFSASIAAFALLAAGSWPFADLPRRCVGFDDAAELLGSMAGEPGAAPPPVHGVFVPG